MAASLSRRPAARRIFVGGPWRRMGANVGVGHVRSRDWLRCLWKIDVDVYRRAPYRVRHTPRWRLHERSWHLRALQLRVAQPGNDDQLHGWRDCDDPIRLSRPVQLTWLQ